VARPRPAAAAEFSACGRGNTVGLTSILDRGQSIEGIFSSLVSRTRRNAPRTWWRCPAAFRWGRGVTLVECCRDLWCQKTSVLGYWWRCLRAFALANRRFARVKRPRGGRWTRSGPAIAGGVYSQYVLTSIHLLFLVQSDTQQRLLLLLLQLLLSLRITYCIHTRQREREIGGVTSLAATASPPRPGRPSA